MSIERMSRIPFRDETKASTVDSNLSAWMYRHRERATKAHTLSAVLKSLFHHVTAGGSRIG